VDITGQEVEHIAKLARLELTEDEQRTFSRQLSAILTYMDELKTLDTSGVEPTATGLLQENVFRDDTVRPSLSQEQALMNAAEQADGCFRVPRILGDR